MLQQLFCGFSGVCVVLMLVLPKLLAVLLKLLAVHFSPSTWTGDLGLPLGFR